MDRDVSDSALDELLAELRDADAEHFDVAVTTDDEWCLSVFSGGLVIWETLERNDPKHLRQVSRLDARRLLGHVARGELQAVEAMPWQPGYGT
jgi:hypothetical protein